MKTEAGHLRLYKLKENTTERQAEGQSVTPLVKDGQLMKAFFANASIFDKSLNIGSNQEVFRNEFIAHTFFFQTIVIYWYI